MANLITDINSAKRILIEAVNAVTKNDGNGANDQWLKSLKEKAEANKDEEAKAKVGTLQFFDGILKSSITSITPPLTDEKQLGRVVSEIRGCQVLTERFFSDVRRLTAKDQPLENIAVTKRNELFQVVDQVQQWLLKEVGGISPSEFGACTNQFLDQMQAGSKALSLTQQLFKNQYLELAEVDLRAVTDAWGDVVSTFVEDAQDTTGEKDSLKIGDPATIARFLCIHNRLETLYGRLESNVSLIN